jgi:transcriptional regulator with XRE-family HTH domain
MMGNTFGRFIKERRNKMGLTLRTFCKNTGYDIAYISRLENGIMLPPVEMSKLTSLTNSLDIKEDTKDWNDFFDLAAAERKTIPEDLVAKNPNVVNILPAFLRTAAKKNITKEDVEKLLELVKGE